MPKRANRNTPAASGLLRWITMPLFCGAILLGAARRSNAQTLMVTTNADAGGQSLRAQLAAAASNDTIDCTPIAGQTIALASTLSIAGKSVSIIAPAGNGVTLDGNTVSQVLNVAPGAGNTVAFSNFTIKNALNAGANGSSTVAHSGVPGASAQGAGIFCLGGALTLNGCTITNNQATGGRGAFGNQNGAGGQGGDAKGAGIFCTGTALTLINCNVSNNQVSAGNGAPAGSSATAAAAGSPGVAQGAGIYCSGGSLTITGGAIANNTATGGNGPIGMTFTIGQNGGAGGKAEGGGIFTDDPPVITGCSIHDNKVIAGPAGNAGASTGSGNSGGNGGAIQHAAGAGIFISNASGAASIVNTTINNNSNSGAQGGNGGRGADDGGPSGAGANGGAFGLGGAAKGAGIFVSGAALTLSIDGSTISANKNTGGAAGIGGTGGNASGAGNQPGGNGGGAAATSSASTGGPALGAGIFVLSGALTISNSTISQNANTGGTGGAGGSGGNGATTGTGGVGADGGPGGAARGAGIFNASGAISIMSSTVASNSNTAGSGGPGGTGGGGQTGGAGGAGASSKAQGGGIYSAAGSLTLQNSTVSSNSQSGAAGANGGNGGIGTADGAGGVGGDGSQVEGDGIYLANNATIQNATIALNLGVGFAGGSGGVGSPNGTPGAASSVTGGGLQISAGATTLASTIVATNQNDDISGAISGANSNNNLIGTNVNLGAVNGTSNQVGAPGAEINPRLGALQNNGGPTPTHLLLAGSPAIDQGANPTALSNDQRGGAFPRQVGSAVDAGAVEADTLAPTAALGSAPNVNNASNATQYTFTVVYTDNAAVDISTLGNSNIRVSGPAGFNQLAAFVSTSPPASAAALTATYKFTPPGGIWSPSANGAYNITLQPNQVADTSTNPVAAANLGSFNVTVLAFTTQPTAAPTLQGVQLPVQFTAAAAGAGALTYVWDFGDGSTDSGSSVIHVYANPGDFTARLTATDGSGQTITASAPVTIVPVATITSAPSATPNPAFTGQNIQFDTSASGPGPLTYAWDFGDGSAASGNSVTHAFAAVGAFPVKLTVTDSNGRSATSTLSVTINAITPDSDITGNGFTHAVITELGGDPYSPTPPFNLQPNPAKAGSFTLKRFRITLQFFQANRDQISLMGVLSLPPSFKPADQIVLVDIGHVVRAFRLNAKGKSVVSILANGESKSLNDSFVLKTSKTKSAFTVAISGGAFQTALDSEPDPAQDLTPDQGTMKTRKVRATIYINNQVFEILSEQKYVAKTGRFGK